MITEAAPTVELKDQLDRIEKKLEQVLRYTENLEHRVEGLTEFKEDVVPIVNDAGKLASHKLMQLEASGTLGTLREITGALTDPTMLRTVSRVSNSLVAAQERDEKVGLFKAMRDPEVRRGMAVMMSVLRELGGEVRENNQNGRALTAPAQDS